MMDFNELTEEQKAKARACSTPEELAALAREEGIELSDGQLEAVSGGETWDACNHLCALDGECPLVER